MKNQGDKVTYRMTYAGDGKRGDNIVNIGCSEQGVYATGFHNENLQAVIGECLRMAREKFPGKFFSVEAKELDMDYGDLLPDGSVFVRPFSGKPVQEASDIEAVRQLAEKNLAEHERITAGKVYETTTKKARELYEQLAVQPLIERYRALLMEYEASDAEVPSVTLSHLDWQQDAEQFDGGLEDPNRKTVAVSMLDDVAWVAGDLARNIRILLETQEPTAEEAPDILAVTRRMFR